MGWTPVVRSRSEESESIGNLNANNLLLLFAAFVSSSLSADESVHPDKATCCFRR